MDERRKRLIETSLLVAAIAISSACVYGLHYSYTGPLRVISGSHTQIISVESSSYPFPLHGDEWYHLAQAMYIVETGTLGFTNPYISSPSYQPYHADFELGYHLFLAAIFSATGADPVLNYQYLPAAFFAVNALFMFLFVRRFAGSVPAGLVSIPFMLAIPSNVYITGNWFATPLTFSLFMAFWFFLSLDDFLKQRKMRHAILCAAAYAAAAFTYPLAAAAAAILAPVLIIPGYRTRRRKPPFDARTVKTAAALLPLAVPAALFLMGGLTYSLLWSPAAPDLSLPLYYGILPLAAAALGAFSAIKKRMSPILVAWPAVFLALSLSYAATGYGIIFPFERSVYYLLVGTVPLASIGLVLAAGRARDFIGKAAGIRNAHVLSSFMALLILLNFLVVFDSAGRTHEKDYMYAIYHLVEEPQYDAIKFMQARYGTGNKIMTDDFTAVTIYPLSLNRVVAMQPGNLGHGSKELVWDFFEGGCESKMGILNQRNATLVLSKKPIACDFLYEAYADSDGAYLYEVRA